MKSRQKNGRDSRSRETEVGEKIAVTSIYQVTELSYQTLSLADMLKL